MSELSSAREALIAEAIGEAGRLIERLEAIAPALDANRQALVQSGQAIAGQLAAFETRMAAITENAKLQAVRHIARRTDEMAARTLTAQTRAMEEASLAMFRSELGPALQRLSAQQQPPGKLAGPFARWQTHAATAAVTSALTWAMAAWLWAR
ncbi:MAG TPA: hypothetical protein VLA61_26800 [Ideonella sp.]|uniref:hypothetical protein n=1 Tax=Ideonella sp. TaxID=1929293 RepID=UPI002C1559CC|nr:hypothetical protein [Ideonella sp.]HSI51893.1 hypothetical protein [Ideonella sp.]